MNKIIGIIVVASLLVVGTMLVINKSKSTGPIFPPFGEGAATSTEKTLAMSEVSMHKNQTSCYTVVSGVVYDLTEWIAQHPGGRDAILALCGKDGTEAFTNQHGGMPTQAEILAGYKIGVVGE